MLVKAIDVSKSNNIITIIHNMLMINNPGTSIIFLELDVNICQQINGHFYLLICKYYNHIIWSIENNNNTHTHRHTHTHTTNNMITVPFRLKIIITTPQN